MKTTALLQKSFRNFFKKVPTSFKNVSKKFQKQDPFANIIFFEKVCAWVGRQVGRWVDGRAVLRDY